MPAPDVAKSGSVKDFVVGREVGTSTRSEAVTSIPHSLWRYARAFFHEKRRLSSHGSTTRRTILLMEGLLCPSSQLGKGSYGVVHAAVRKSDRKQLVLKVVKLSGLSKRARLGPFHFPPHCNLHVSRGGTV